MSRPTNAVFGTNYAGCRSFEVSFTSSSTAETAIATGSYSLYATQDCYVKFGKTGMGAAVALTGSQPAVTDNSGQTIKLIAGQKEPLDICGGITHFRVIRATADGVLTINGPLLAAINA